MKNVLFERYIFFNIINKMFMFSVNGDESFYNKVVVMNSDNNFIWFMFI